MTLRLLRLFLTMPSSDVFLGKIKIKCKPPGPTILQLISKLQIRAQPSTRAHPL